MKITKIDIPKSNQFGLDAITMERLGEVVILAGKNGAGKTRLLDMIHGWTKIKIVLSQNLSLTLARACEVFWLIPAAKQFTHLPRNGWWQDDIAIEQYTNHYKCSKEVIQKNFYELDFDSVSIPEIVKFVPKNVSLIDPNGFNKIDLQTSAETVKTIGVSNLSRGSLAHIQALQDKWREVTHQFFSGEESDKAKIIKDYTNLKDMIKIFLGADLDRNNNSDATIFGLPIGQAKMSDGQKILLQFCVAFHAQVDNLSELIILMDEPENHLHPSAMLDVINKFKKVLPNGQIWIATHSIPLLANFDPDCIWWMDDGKVKHVGSQPEIVLQGLLGDDDRIEKLHDFLGLPAVLAANNFAYQCLLSPNVTSQGLDDPQTSQIRKVILNSLGDKTLRVFDFGAGRGRLLSTIHEALQAELSQKIDYYAFDISNKYRYECKATITRIYKNDPTNRYFLTEREVLSKLDKNSVDVIVMCNVLHEIDPSEWLPLFGENGILRQLLKHDGFLLLIEDTEMRIGEKAHSRGFLVLDTAELKTLFSITENDKDFAMDDARGDGRLKAHCIPASCLKEISKESLHSSLTQLSHLAIEELKKMRATNYSYSYRNGRKHAFYTQQFTTAQLVLESLGQ